MPATSKLKLIVTFKDHEIVATDTEIDFYLGYPNAQIHGATIKLFHGDQTDLRSLQAAIEAAQHSETSVETFFYTRSGDSQMVKVTCKPYLNESGCLVACLTSIDICSENANSNDSDGPWTSVWEKEIEKIVSPQEFYSITGSSRNESSDSSENDTSGIYSFNMESSPESPSIAVDAASTSHYDFHKFSSQIHVNAQAALVFSPEPSDACLQEPGHVVFPRRKAGDGIFYSSPKPIVVTLRALEAIKGFPLVAAAETLGISTTAFKRACRALGIRRWSYQKSSPQRSTAARRAAITPAAPALRAAGEAGAVCCWLVTPPLGADGPMAGGAGWDLDPELSGEGEVLTGPAVFEWPRYA